MKRKFIGTLALLLATASGATSDEVQSRSVESRFYGTLERFEWREFGEAGDKLLKESGPLYGIGAEMRVPLVTKLAFDPRGRIFFGDIDYDGSIQTLTGDEPYKSSASYIGYEAEGLVSYAWNINDQTYLRPLAGIGFRYWQRTLDADLSDEFIGPYGYVEYWAVSYWMGGVEGGMKIGLDGLLFCRLEGRRPYDISEEIDISNAGQPSDVSVEPKARTGFRAEVGYTQQPFLVAAFFETQNFGASELDKKYNVFSQPKSEATIYGIKLGLAF